MLIRRKIFGCLGTKVGSACAFTNVDTAAVFQEPGAAEAISLGECYDLTIDIGILEIDTGILLFEAVDLDFHDFDMDAGVQLFEANVLLTEVAGL